MTADTTQGADMDTITATITYKPQADTTLPSITITLPGMGAETYYRQGEDHWTTALGYPVGPAGMAMGELLHAQYAAGMRDAAFRVETA